MRQFFISYRRHDEHEFVEQIRDHLHTRFGVDNVFMDIDAIPLFVRFVDHLRPGILLSQIILVVVGNRWLDLLREKTELAIEDYVRFEIELAIESGKQLIILCIKKASVPLETELPPSLRAILKCPVMAIDDKWLIDERMTDMVQLIGQQAAISEPKTPPSNEYLLARQYHDWGQVKHNLKAYANAVLDYNDAIQFDPDNPNYYLARAISYIEQFNMRAAREDLDRVISLDPNNLEAYLKRASVFTNAIFPSFLDAAADYGHALDLDRNNHNLYVLRGEAYANANHLELAMPDYAKAIELAPPPGNPKAHTLRGIGYGRWKDWDAATHDYLEAIRIDPDFSDFYDPYDGLKYLLSLNDSNVSTRACVEAFVSSDPQRYARLGELVASYDAAIEKEANKGFIVRWAEKFNKWLSNRPY